MKTVLIETNNNTPRNFCDYLEKIGLFTLKRDKKGTAFAFEYIEGVSGKPEFKSDRVHVWLYEEKNKALTGKITHHRINISNDGEAILKANNLKYEFEK